MTNSYNRRRFKREKKKLTEIGQREAACQLQLTSFSAASKRYEGPRKV